MSAAYKTAMLQPFCVPIAEIEDPDARTYKLRKGFHEPAPPQGWDQWTAETKSLILVCKSEEALALVQDANRTMLRSLSRERADFYKVIGDAAHEQRGELPVGKISARPKARAKNPSKTDPNQAGDPIRERADV